MKRIQAQKTIKRRPFQETAVGKLEAITVTTKFVRRLKRVHRACQMHRATEEVLLRTDPRTNGLLGKEQ
jgi:hypothetical protein